MDACVSYFNKSTQYDVPIRQIGAYGAVANPPPPPNQPQAVAPCNTWVCTPNATEYECMGLRYTPQTADIGGNTYITNYLLSYMDLDEWSAQWQDGTCLALFQDMVTGLGTSQTAVAFSIPNFQAVQDDFNFMFSRYFNHDPTTQYQGATGPCDPTALGPANGSTGQNGGKYSNADNNCNVYINGTYGVVPPGQKAYNGFLDTLFDACQNMPGVCSNMQNYMCKNCSRPQIYANPYLTNLCGCVPYIDTGNEFYNSTISNYDPTCDPLCNRLDTIKNVNLSTGRAQECNANVCVMDAVQINSITSTGVVPTFNQVCPACADGQNNCICIVDATFDSTIPSVKGVDGQSLDTAARFTQYCPNSQCYIKNPETNVFEPVECATTLPKGNEAHEVTVPIWVYIVALVIVIVAVLAIFAYKYKIQSNEVYLVSSKYFTG
jgi:hypothetical protein